MTKIERQAKNEDVHLNPIFIMDDESKRILELCYDAKIGPGIKRWRTGVYKDGESMLFVSLRKRGKWIHLSTREKK